MVKKTPILSLKDICLTLKSNAGEVKILKNISLSVDAGKTVSVVGPSGSGKTSLMMLIGGLENVTKGDMVVANHNITHMSEAELSDFRRQHVGIVFQNFHLIPTMTALENVAVSLEFSGDKHAKTKAADLLEKVGLKDRLDHYPSQLSGGEQQRVAIARAFVAEPTLLLADEPTGNLDEKTGKKVIDLMFDLSKKSGTTLMLVTHDPKLAKKCDQTVQLLDGQIKA